MVKSFDIVERAFDKKWVLWGEVDAPGSDTSYYNKAGIPCPTIYVPLFVGFTRDSCVKAIKSVKITSFD